MLAATLIRLTELHGKRILVNLGNVTYMAPSPRETETDGAVGTWIHFVGGETDDVIESPDVVMEKVSSG